MERIESSRNETGGEHLVVSEDGLKLALRNSEWSSATSMEHFDGEVAFLKDVLGALGERLEAEDTLHLVRFIDGAANQWHTHASRQVLIFTEGRGFVETATYEKEPSDDASRGKADATEASSDTDAPSGDLEPRSRSGPAVSSSGRSSGESNGESSGESNRVPSVRRRVELSEGDAVVVPAEVVHRHGAVPGATAAHIAIQSGEARWLS